MHARSREPEHTLVQNVLLEAMRREFSRTISLKSANSTTRCSRRRWKSRSSAELLDMLEVGGDNQLHGAFITSIDREGDHPASSDVEEAHDVRLMPVTGRQSAMLIQEDKVKGLEIPPAHSRDDGRPHCLSRVTRPAEVTRPTRKRAKSDWQLDDTASSQGVDDPVVDMSEAEMHEQGRRCINQWNAGLGQGKVQTGHGVPPTQTRPGVLEGVAKEDRKAPSGAVKG
jgi:hypothetical protein